VHWHPHGNEVQPGHHESCVSHIHDSHRLASTSITTLALTTHLAKDSTMLILSHIHDSHRLASTSITTLALTTHLAKNSTMLILHLSCFPAADAMGIKRRARAGEAKSSFGTRSIPVVDE
jgi:hypothetical protein